MRPKPRKGPTNATSNSAKPAAFISEYSPPFNDSSDLSMPPAFFTKASNAVHHPDSEQAFTATFIERNSDLACHSGSTCDINVRSPVFRDGFVTVVVVVKHSASIFVRQHALRAMNQLTASTTMSACVSLNSSSASAQPPRQSQNARFRASKRARSIEM
jgi:hypothetical protein